MARQLKLSVIIPTYNRPQILKLCLEALQKQTLDKKLFEIIVVHDDKKQGPAAARNKGIKKACGKIILFLGDDIIADKDLLKNHLLTHAEYSADNFSVLGFVSWHPDLEKTPFLEWLETSGAQADYQALKNNQSVSFKHFYTSNISLKRNFLIKFGMFDEDFKYPLFEDTELGFRLCRKGLKIIYSRNAKAWHLHPQDLTCFLTKMKLAGKVGRMLYQKHPRLLDKIFPIQLPLKEILRLRFYQLLYPWGKLTQNKKILFQNFQRLTNQALIKSFHS